MYKCLKCGAECGDGCATCPSCGAELPLGAQSGEEASVQERLMAVFSYLGVLFLVPLFVCGNSGYVRYHVNQGLTLFLTEVIIAILSTVLWVIPPVGWIVSLAVCLPLYLVTVAFMVVGIVHAVGGETVGLPLTGRLQLLK